MLARPYDVEIISLSELGEGFWKRETRSRLRNAVGATITRNGRQRHVQNRVTKPAPDYLTQQAGTAGRLSRRLSKSLDNYYETSRRRLPVLAGEFASRIRHLVHLTNWRENHDSL